MRLKPFLICFSGILTLYMLRAGYSYSKPYFKQQYKLSNLLFSTMDTFIYIGVGIGYMVRYLIFGHYHPIKVLTVSGFTMCLFFSFLPLVSLIQNQVSQHIEKLLLYSVFLFGFLQFYFEPALTQQLKKFYKLEHEELLSSFWLSAGHIGKCLGLMFVSTAVINLKWVWQTPLLDLTCLMIVVVMVIYYFFFDREVQTLEESGIQNPHLRALPDYQREEITWDEFLDFTKECFQQPEIKFYILLACCYKSMHQNITHWLPSYLFARNYRQFAGQITVVFITPIICGPFLINKFYENSRTTTQQTFAQTIIFLTTTAIVASTGLIMMNFVPVKQIQFVILITIEGICIGGFYDLLLSNQEVMGNFNSRKKEMMWTLIKGCTNIATGLMNFAIRVTMSVRQHTKQKDVQQSIWFVVEIVSILSLPLLIMWVCQVQSRLDRETYQHNQLNQQVIAP